MQNPANKHKISPANQSYYYHTYQSYYATTRYTNLGVF